MRLLLLIFNIALVFSSVAQSIHQEQSSYYASLGWSDSTLESQNTPRIVPPKSRAACTLNKMVYGWHPYWSNGLQVNYDWSLLSHFCYFSYEVDAATGNALSTHSFSTTSSVTDALANGVRVDLCVTLFSSHTTFLSSATSRQNLINNLISLISSRGAHGVNIDFEGIPSSQKTNFTNFMNDLASQMHSAIPGSQVSSVLYAVDWNDVLDVAAMTEVDFFVIMGYDYYWTGSSTAGPNDPLYQFGSSYNYTLSRSVTYYLDKGLAPSKLVLGLPYYGREWSVASTGIPATTLGSGVSRTYNYVRDNASGNYTTGNRHFDNQSFSAYYEFPSAGTKQCFISEEFELSKRMDFIVKRGLAGMGIWALGYDDGYSELWDAIGQNMTNCRTDLCYDTLYDMGGGPHKNYYDNEDYTYTLAPPGASQITLDFTTFNLENGYDFLYVYDGNSLASPPFPGSPFTGASLPPDLTSSGGSITLRFTSDGSTTSSGYTATYQCLADTIAPNTNISVSGSWQTTPFTANFTDTDNAGGSGPNQKFYQALDYNGTEWRANPDKGFFNDQFNTSLHADWTTGLGTWSVTSSQLQQASNAESNTNLYTLLTQTSSNAYLYHWKMNMTGTGSNRRAGMHFFCDNPSLPNRGNSYFVYFRVDSDKCQIYEVISDTYYLMADVDVTVNPSTWYDCKIYYNPQSGLIQAYLNDQLAAEWTDGSPLTTGNSISLRTGNTSTLYDDVKVYLQRSNAETIDIGSLSNTIRFQNYGLLQPSCQLVSLINDSLFNWSNPVSENINIDWTPPADLLYVNDSIGIDIDAQTDSTKLTGQYSTSSDIHSSIDEYWYSIGISPGDSSVVAWTNNSINTFFVASGLSLSYGQTYFINVKCKNGAGLWSNSISSDGITIIEPTTPPVCNFNLPVTEICSSEFIGLANSTIGANTYDWNCAGAVFDHDSIQFPTINFPVSGVYSIELIASGPGGSDTLTMLYSVTVYQNPIAQYTINEDTLEIPTAFLACTNTSSNATSYQWNFGDGNSSTATDPWNNYTGSGIFTLSLIASNGYCPQDTMATTIVVQDAIGITEQQKNNKVLIYPNPTTEILMIEVDALPAALSIVNSVGQIVIQLNIPPHQKTILNTSNWPYGLYKAILQRENTVIFEQKILKHH